MEGISLNGLFCAFKHTTKAIKGWVNFTCIYWVNFKCLLTEQALSSVVKGPWRELASAFEIALGMLPKRNETPNRLMDILDGFKTLKERVEHAFEAAFEKTKDCRSEEADNSSKYSSYSNKMNPTGSTSDPHILVTKKLYPVSSNINEIRKKKNSDKKSLPTVKVETLEENLDAVQWSNSGKREMKSDVDIPTVMAACPSFAEMARDLVGYVQNWDDFHRAAGQIRPMCGISEEAWNVAQQKLSPYVAAAAIALIFDKHTAGEVDSPGGYLRGMVGKAMSGELHLDRSFYGRLNEVRV